MTGRWWAALSAALLLAAFLSLLVGSANIPVGDVIGCLAGQGDPKAVTVIREIRLPRMLLGLLVGGALGISGAALQGLLRNPLAEPGLVGTSASAGLGSVVAIYFGWAAAHPLALPLAAIGTGAVGTVLLLLAAGRQAGPMTLILAGVAISSLAVALTSLAMNLSPNPYALTEMVLWLMGSLKDRSMQDVVLAAPFVALGGVLLSLTGRGLDALSLGEEAAASLGVDLSRLRHMIVIGCALAVGGAVAAAGAVGFVGLVVPHLLRPLARQRPSLLLLPSAMGGALLITLADVTARVVPSSSEMMLGVLTSIVGAPFFLTLLLKMRRSHA
ncbi:MAG: iron ABC transporter permease [Telmatospirillum sp.]|nr:iron ABC transporter permease [Telmatospirillum sp.]